MPKMGRRYWLRILFANTAGAVAAFGLLGGFITSAPWSSRGRTLAVCFVYANSIGTLMASLIPSITDRVEAHGWLVRGIVRLVTISMLTIAGCLIAGVVLIAIGISRPSEYWAYLSGSLWVAFLVGTVASLSVTGYETLRGQLEATSLELKSQQLEEARARKLAIEAQLASLESRVHPHFLFNTLNSIAELVHDDPAAAERVVGQLARLLRSSLDSGATPLVPLEQELRLVRDYLEIERVRFGDRLRYTIDAPADLSSLPVPRLALQTLVENSVKYAVSARRGGASLVVRAIRADGGVRLEVKDDGPGFDAANTPAGHGLALVRERLAMTFGARASLTIDSRPGTTAVAIDLRS